MEDNHKWHGAPIGDDDYVESPARAACNVERIGGQTMTTQQISMRDAFGQALLDFADAFSEMVVLDADVSSSTKTGMFAQRYPERFFNVGVAEANMVDIAGGLATCGLRPVVSTFALFLALKCADQVRNVLCYNNLPVVLAAGYAGLSDSYDAPATSR